MNSLTGVIFGQEATERRFLDLLLGTLQFFSLDFSELDNQYLPQDSHIQWVFKIY